MSQAKSLEWTVVWLSRFLVFAILLVFTGACFAYDDLYLQAPQLSEEQKQEQQFYKNQLKERKIPRSAEAFIKYVKKGDIQTAEIFLKAGISANTNFYTDYPIYFAVKSKNPDMVQLLLDYGAKPNIGFESPLYFAIKEKQPQIARLLIENGADVNYRDFITDTTILYAALSRGLYDTACDLIKAGAKVDPLSAAFIEKKNLGPKLGL